MTDVVIRHSCGHKFIKDVTLWKTGGKCPKCGGMIDSSYAGGQ